MSLDHASLLETAKALVQSTAEKLFAADRGALGSVTDRQLGEREVKLVADKFLESELMNGLARTGVKILSEETEESHHQSMDGPLWIIDPLDGSYNFSRNLGPSMICVALWDNHKPAFGVLYDLSTRVMYWGGKGLGAHSSHGEIRVSTESSLLRSTVCTGFPSRFPATDPMAIGNYMSEILKFAKVRMIGSAAASLVLVARGAADAYFERNIMVWDVAAALALVEGAGGSFELAMTSFHESLTVLATNSVVPFSMP